MLEFIGKCHPLQDPPQEPRRVPIQIHPVVRERLARLLYEDAFRGVGYSAFINRAIEVAEKEIHQRRQMKERLEEARRAQADS